MKITVYELLRLIKEGKRPYKFIFKDDEYRWDYEDCKYYRKAGIDENEQKYFEIFENDYNLYFVLTDEVEIIEEKEIEKIGKSFKSNSLNDDVQRQILTVQHNCALAVNKIDELIDEINKLKRDRDE